MSYFIALMKSANENKTVSYAVALQYLTIISIDVYDVTLGTTRVYTTVYFSYSLRLYSCQLY